MGGMAALQRLLPEAKIITSRATANDMSNGGTNDYRYVFENQGMNLSERFEPMKVDDYIKHLGELTLGNVTMVAHLTLGHTLGTTTWTMKVKDKGKDYQMVVMGSMSAPGHDSGPLLNNELYPNIVEDFQTSFAHLKKLQCDVYLYVRAASIEMDSKLAMLKKVVTRSTRLWTRKVAVIISIFIRHGFRNNWMRKWLAGVNKDIIVSQS